MPLYLETSGITKRFGPTTANENVGLLFNGGKIYAILGENGAGKTTFLNILAGIYRADSGRISLNGSKVRFKSPKDALKHGIFLVQQNFAHVENFTVAENLALLQGLSLKPIKLNQIIEKSRSSFPLLASKVDPGSIIWKLPMNFRQLVEIQKGLLVRARIFMLDEPTSVLGPQEAEELGVILKTLASEGRVIIITSHKVDQVMRISTDFIVMRSGKVVFTGSADEIRHSGQLIRHMFGEDFEVVMSHKEGIASEALLDIRNLEAKDEKGHITLTGVDLEVRRGEIYGIVGVAGNGQKELAEVIVGLEKPTKGSLVVGGHNTGSLGVGETRRLGVSYIPEEGSIIGSVPDLSVAENLSLTTYDLDDNSAFINEKNIHNKAERLIAEYGIVPPNSYLAAKYLSGGNIQKLIVARELSRSSNLLVCYNPTKGLDIKTTGLVHKKIIEKRNSGTAILLISEDIEEIMEFSDRVGVMFGGKLVAVRETERMSRKELGEMMSGRFEE